MVQGFLTNGRLRKASGKDPGSEPVDRMTGTPSLLASNTTGSLDPDARWTL